MKRNLIIIILMILLASQTVYGQTIGENFEAGSIVLGGGGYYSNTLEDTIYTDWYFSVSPYISTYLIDGLYASFSIGLYMSEYELSNNFSIGAGVYYNFGYDPAAATGLCLSVGAGIDFEYYLESGDMAVEISPQIELEYFLAPRISTHLTFRGVDLQFGTNVTEVLDTYLNVSFGISFYIPDSEQTLF